MLSITINVTWRTIMGALFIGATVAVSSLAIVRAEHVAPDTSVYKCNSGNACLTGDSSSSKTLGIRAVGPGTGLQGETSTTASGSGVAGISTATTGNGHGVYGKSSNGDGVYGTSSTANGVYGITSSERTGRNPAAGVYGTSSALGGVGVEGTSTAKGGDGVLAENFEGATALLAVAFEESYTTPKQDIFEAVNQFGSGFVSAECNINTQATMYCSGGFTSGTQMLTQQRAEAGRHVLTYSAQSATPTIEDLGVAQMRDGIANVELPADFASVMEHSNPYYVFLTPMGDTSGLYVSMENAAGFQVRENMRGRSNVTFQYRIIGVPLGERNLRLPTAPAMNVPRLPKLPPPVR